MSKSRVRSQYAPMSGVSAILNATSKSSAQLEQMASIEDIQLSPHQPRRYFDPARMEELTQSVQEHGILEPLLVRPLGQGYELVAGERRLRAAQAAGLSEVPIVSRQFSDEQAMQVALIENLQREDLNPIEETEGILQLLALKLDVEPQMVVSLLYRMENEAKGKITRNVTGNDEADVVMAVFQSLGVMTWRSFVRNRLPVLKWPQDVLSWVRQGKLAYTKASAIARVQDAAQRQNLLRETVAEDLSLTDLKAKIKDLKAEVHSKTKQREPLLKQRFEATYQQAKCSKVWTDPTKKDELESLLHRLEQLLSSE